MHVLTSFSLRILKSALQGYEFVGVWADDLFGLQDLAYNEVIDNA